MIRKRRSLLSLDPVKDGKDQSSDAFGHSINDGVPFHPRSPMGSSPPTGRGLPGKELLF